MIGLMLPLTLLGRAIELRSVLLRRIGRDWHF